MASGHQALASKVVVPGSRQEEETLAQLESNEHQLAARQLLDAFDTVRTTRAQGHHRNKSRAGIPIQLTNVFLKVEERLQSYTHKGEDVGTMALTVGLKGWTLFSKRGERVIGRMRSGCYDVQSVHLKLEGTNAPLVQPFSITKC
ncbi:hypothetical protein FNV43_RR24449 [Rhamnella rubrinervis]|uniref:Uncharacterized protein n=1 Tax=Rhamnella rubrinervis TaxID=2594499 RepID=A0A8K0GL81_9ROSA|nr:hypothetical protein FNV43_RR24449 [Rhamnella rubrinervis]